MQDKSPRNKLAFPSPHGRTGAQKHSARDKQSPLFQAYSEWNP